MKKFINLIKTAGAILLASVAVSCGINAGLGEEVDTKPPVLKISSPDSLSYVQDGFKLVGTASDNKGVTEITIECKDNNDKWKTLNGEWHKLNQTTGEWEAVSESKLEGEIKNYSFEVPIIISTVDTISDYTFEIIAYDAPGNSDKDTKQTRKVTVDSEVPKVMVLKPTLDKNKVDADNHFATYELQNNMYLTNLINGKFTVSGSQEEDNPSILTITLDNGVTANPDEDVSEIYATKTIDDPNILRNWSFDFDVNSAEDFPSDSIRTFGADGKRLVRVVIEAVDKTGTQKEKKAHGWFILWPEADKPWLKANFGHDSDPEQSDIYPKYSIQGQAFDDDGIGLISVSIFKENGDLVKQENFDLSPVYEKYKSWTVVAPESKGNYYAQVSVQDKNGIKGDSVTKYFHIQDIQPPSIEITSPESGSSVIGDENGDFTIKGRAWDDGSLKSVKVVRIKPGKESTQLKYLDSFSSLWNVPDGTTDSNGNKVYTLYTKSNGADPISSYEINKKFNLFDDFGINGTTGNTLTNQTFIFLVVDSGNSGTIGTFSVSGDLEAPEVSIDELYVNKKPAKEFNTAANDLSSTDAPLPAWNKDSENNITDKVMFKGHWSDNTFATYKNLEKIAKVKLSWTGAQTIDEKIVVTMYSDGTWETNEFTPANSTAASLTATLQDWGGNIGKGTASFTVESNLPELLRVSSDKADGYYKAGEVITVITEFNKNVTFSGGSSNPVLRLNNNATAEYFSGNGTSRHVYRYTVANGQDTTLNVTGITENGNTWKDSSDKEVSMTIQTTGEKSFIGGKTIVVDTVKPAISSISSITSSGYYGANKNIFFSIKFSEKVKIADVSKIKIKLNVNNEEDVFATNATVTGDDTVMFTYTVQNGENASPLKIVSMDYSEAGITDSADNALANVTTYPANPFAGIVIDTVAPAKPVISGMTTGTIYSDEGTKFTVEGTESGATVEYTIDGGTSWSIYNGQVSLNNNGEYTVKARQTDLAGNKSDISNESYAKIDKGDILKSITSTSTDGIYTYSNTTSQGDEISILLKFRKDVEIGGAKTLTLNTTPVHTAVYDAAASTGSTKVFKYTVADGDQCTKLNVTAINATFTCEEADVTDYCGIPSGENLTNNRNIQVITGVPVIRSVALTNASLKITFSENVTKNSGEIVFTQEEETYIPPVALSESDYSFYAGKSDTIKNGYEKTTNGSSELGVADLTTKYILKFDQDLDSVKSGFVDNGALETTVSIGSTAVSVDGAVLTVDFSKTAAPKVKGANYTVIIPENAVYNSITHGNPSKTAVYKLPGIEKPVIRINKTKETISGTTITQPLTAGVKMDCQTPGASIYYVNATKTSATKVVGRTQLPENGATRVMAADTSSNHTSAPAVPGTSSTKYTSSFTVGSNTNWGNGYKVLLRARATNDNGTTWSEDGYEAAMRSVVVFDGTATTPGTPPFGSTLYIRGGDAEAGGVSVAGYPISWESTEFDKVRPMTVNGGKSYFVTWNISKTGYFGFLAGDFPSDVATNGPKNWCWLSCGYVPFKKECPIYPGESITMPGSGYNKINSTERGNLGYQDKHRETRNNDGTVTTY